jgi:hypothetical protein
MDQISGRRLEHGFWGCKKMKRGVGYLKHVEEVKARVMA